MKQSSLTKRRCGFSLVELSVVVIIIGVLAAFGVPRMLKSVERSKASEAFKWLGSLRAAQERRVTGSDIRIGDADRVVRQHIANDALVG